MPDGTKTPPREFLVVSLPDKTEAGATLRMLGVANSQAAAEKLVDKLDPGVLGRVAILERRRLFLRQTAVETRETADAIARK